MLIKDHIINGTMIISISGRFTFQSRKEFQEVIAKAVQSSARKVVLNLAELSFVDSSAIGLLSLANDSLKNAGLDFQLAKPQGYVQQALNLFKMSDLIPITSSIEEGSPAPIKG